MKQIECAHKNKELLKNDEDGRLKGKGDKDKSNGEQLVNPILPKWPIQARFKLFNIKAIQYFWQAITGTALLENALIFQMPKTTYFYLSQFSNGSIYRKLFYTFFKF